MAFGTVQEGAAVGPEQPFVGREDHKIRVEMLYIHRQHAGALRRVDQEGGVLFSQRCPDFLDVDQPTVRPMHR